MFTKNTEEFGRLEVSAIPLPSYAKGFRATYTFSGTILLHYERSDDPDEKDYFHFAVMNDDGSGFRTIFSGVIPEHERANGIRHMVFADNKRILLGDYVLECSPDIDTCEESTLVPVEYPWQLLEDPLTWRHWSEVIIAPDNKHIAWTILRNDHIGAINALGVLARKADRYVIEQPQIISTLERLKLDANNPDYVLPQIVRGGEVKQFVRGGTAISVVGSKDGYVADSILQDLRSAEITQITRTPGYDETTVFSPDERLGLVMTSRGSQHTDPAIVGWMPRPYGQFVTQGLTMFLYMYTVTGVRNFRPGNIGPALVNIERSINEKGYKGVMLHDPAEEWVFVSPISWHPAGNKAMWAELMRGTLAAPKGVQLRLQKLTLHDYQPAPAVATQLTPDDIPYGIGGDKAIQSLRQPPKGIRRGKIAGKHSGCVEFCDGGQNGAFAGSAEITYHNYSDDGATFFNGFEKLNYSFMSGSQYKADVTMSGAEQGEMKLRMAFSGGTFEEPPKLLFDADADGKPKSDGYVTYDGVTLRVDDLLA